MTVMIRWNVRIGGIGRTSLTCGLLPSPAHEFLYHASAGRLPGTYKLRQLSADMAFVLFLKIEILELLCIFFFFQRGAQAVAFGVRRSFRLAGHETAASAHTNLLWIKRTEMNPEFINNLRSSPRAMSTPREAIKSLARTAPSARRRVVNSIIPFLQPAR
jgi:Trk-type K+ transport system membrane component